MRALEVLTYLFDGANIKILIFFLTGLELLMSIQPCESNIWDKLGVPSRGIALLSDIESGFAYEVFPKIAELVQMNERKLAASLSISPATLRRRKKAGYFSTVNWHRYGSIPLAA